MLLKEIAYQMLEQFTSNNISDDEEVDYRLVEAWIKMKRAVLLRQKPRADIGLNNIQTFETTMGAEENSFPGVSQTIYPFKTSGVQGSLMHISDDDIPKILEDDWGPIIFDITSSDKLKFPYSFKPYHELRFCGNGRFNGSLIYLALLDHKLIAKSNQQFEDDEVVRISAIFEDPTQVAGFDEYTMDYPCSLDIIEAIKKSILDVDFKLWMATSRTEDSVNDANDDN